MYSSIFISSLFNRLCNTVKTFFGHTSPITLYKYTENGGIGSFSNSCSRKIFGIDETRKESNLLKHKKLAQVFLEIYKKVIYKKVYVLFTCKKAYLIIKKLYVLFYTFCVTYQVRVIITRTFEAPSLKKHFYVM
jgi:hypothetical protein